MSRYSVEMRVHVSVDDGSAPESVASEVADALINTDSGHAAHVSHDDVSSDERDFLIELEVKASSPAEAAIASSTMLLEAARRRAIIAGPVPAGPWKRAIRATGLSARELPESATADAEDTTLLAF